MQVTILKIRLSGTQQHQSLNTKTTQCGTNNLDISELILWCVLQNHVRHAHKAFTAQQQRLPDHVR